MNPLNTVRGTVIGGLATAAVIALLTAGNGGDRALIAWIHVLAGVTWIGLLYYFNFVQIPALADAAADRGGPGGSGITKYVAPRALLWFRWAAVVTWLAGAAFLLRNHQFVGAFTLGAVSGGGDRSYQLTIGIGAWLGTVMLCNVWLFIWPSQKKLLGMVEATAQQIHAGRRTAFLASRLNALLSVPMLMCMVGAHHGFFL
jgi:uncharacterized membrane protein